MGFLGVLLPAQRAAVTAGAAFDHDGAQARHRGCEVAVDVAAEVLQRGDAQVGDLVEEMVIEPVAHLRDLGPEQRQIDHHALGIGCAAHGHFGLVGVAMHAAAALGLDHAAQRVGGLEVKALGQFVHGGGWMGHGMSRILCV